MTRFLKTAMRFVTQQHTKRLSRAAAFIIRPPSTLFTSADSAKCGQITRQKAPFQGFDYQWSKGDRASVSTERHATRNKVQKQGKQCSVASVQCSAGERSFESRGLIYRAFSFSNAACSIDSTVRSPPAGTHLF